MAGLGFDRDARKLVRQRFRRIVKNVMINRAWLVEADDDKMTLNVKQNVALFLRQKRKIGILSKAEKALLRTPHAMRSVADRKKLVHLFAHLPCFSRFPPKIRARLVPVVSYMMIGPNRMIIRNGDPSRFLYFILSGEIEISKEIYDPVKKIIFNQPIVVVGSGDIHGINGMVENTKRISTSRSITNVELLAVHYEDYLKILHPIMKKELYQKKSCFDALGYFDKMLWGRQVGCRLAVLKQYEPLESIYSEDKGPLTFVHFVVSGECMILQCLRMKVTAKKGKEKTFELVKIRKGEDMEQIFHNMKGMDLMSMARKNVEISQRRSKTSEIQFLMKKDLKGNQKESKYEISAKELEAIEKDCASRKPAPKIIEDTEYDSIHNEEGISRKIKKPQKQKDKSSKKKKPIRVIRDQDDDFIDVYGEQGENGEEGSFSYDDIESSSSTHSDKLSSIKIPSEVSINEEYYENETDEFDKEFEQEEENAEEADEESEVEKRYSKRTKSIEFEDPDTKIENHFIDVGSLTFGGIFGLGEHLEHRVIMARTSVQCILLPRFWLFEKINNPGEIWDRRRFYIECNIPSRQQLFENFLTTRKWQKFKNDQIERNLGDALKNNPTKVEDIPIISRIVEPNDE